MRALACVFALVVSSAAFGYASGIVGYSGQSGTHCTQCHSASGAAPTVTLSGPISLTGGTTGTYTLTMVGGPGVRGGLDVSVDNPNAKFTAGAGTQSVAGEITHTAPKSFSGGQVSWTFTLLAP